MLDRWWHTAMLASQLYALQTIVVNALSKKGSKLQPKSAADFHPFLKPKDRRAKITTKNFSLLKTIGNALCGNLKRQ